MNLVIGSKLINGEGHTVCVENILRESNHDGVEVFNFGKYKGMSVTDVLKRDPGYYSWILNSDFTLNTKAMLTKIRLRELTNK